MFHTTVKFLLFFPWISCSLTFDEYTLVIHHLPFPANKRQIAVNGTVPGPLINATLGNTLKLTIINKLNHEITAIQLVGLTPLRLSSCAKVPFNSQCLISNLPGNNSITYLYNLETAGTYWYHAYDQLQTYSNGIHGPLVVFDPTERASFENLGSSYGTEDPKWILIFAKWYDMHSKLRTTSSVSFGDRIIPDAFTVNNQFSKQMIIEADPYGDPIRVRIINAGGMYSIIRISVDGMPLQLVELDVTQIHPLDRPFIQLNDAQRCSFVLNFSRIATAFSNSSSVFIRILLRGDMFPSYNNSAPNKNLYGTYSSKPVDLEWVGIIKFKGRNNPVDYTETPILDTLSFTPDSNTLVARAIRGSRAPQPDLYLQFVALFQNYKDSLTEAYANPHFVGDFNQHEPPRTIPNLFDHLYGSYRTGYGSSDMEIKLATVGNPLIPLVSFAKCVEVLINNNDKAEHSFHLHGHVFWIIGTSTFPDAATLYKSNYLVRDVVSIPANGWARIRFKTIDPSLWLFHCPIPAHQTAGFVLNSVAASSRILDNAALVVQIPSKQKSALNLSKKKVIKLGGYFNILNPANQSQFDVEQAQSLAAFMMAVNEINANETLLSNYELRVAVRVSSASFNGAINAAEYLAMTAIFPSLDATKCLTLQNSGVDVVVGAGNDMETVTMSQFFTGRKIIQVHTRAHDSQLGVGASFPYKIATVPTNDFQGLVLHNIICRYFVFKEVIVFAVNNAFGSAAIEEMKNQDICPLNVSVTFTFASDTTSFKTEISLAKTFRVQAIVLIFDDPVMAGMLLEQGYDLGLFRQGIQIFGSEGMTTPLTWQSFKDKSKTSSIMEGFIGIRYDPSYYMKTSEKGQKFVRHFRQLLSISGNANYTNSCYVKSDGLFSVENSNATHCHTLNFSSFSGYDIYPYAPHAYDAVYAVAYAFQNLLQNQQSFDSSTLYKIFLNSSIINFEGVTGTFKLQKGIKKFPFQFRGNRESGHTMRLMNYNKLHGGLVFVGKFSDERTILCDNNSLLIDGYECFPVTYNTIDGLPTGNVPPYTLATTPGVVKIGGLFQIFNSKNQPDLNQAQCLAAFMMAITEINSNLNLLPNTKLVTAITSGLGFSGAIEAANLLVSSKFGGTGVNIIVGSADDIETGASNQVFGYNKLIQIHALSQSVDFSQGSLFPWSIQTTPLASFQGRFLRKLICDVIKLKRVAVFVINSLYGTRTLADFQYSGSACPIKVASVSVVESGQIDFFDALLIAKAAQTRMFLIIFDDPLMAGRLLEQGYNLELFRVGTVVLGTEEISNPLTWNSMSRNNNITRIMKGYLGVRYSPYIGMLTSPQGRTFMNKFSALKSTQWKDINGSVKCDEDSLDDSGDFFLYSKRSNGNVICGGLDFSFLNSTSENIYPFASLVYDAVYAAAYALHDQLVIHNKTVLKPSLFHDALIKRTNFNGASGLVKFFSGNTYYPHDNRGNREDGHTYLIINFNEALFRSSTDGSSGMGASGVISTFNGSVLEQELVLKLLPRGTTYVKFIFNTEDGNLPTNPDVLVDINIGTKIACYILFTICFCVVLVYGTLTILFRSMKVFNDDDRHMFFFILLGGLMFALRALITGLDTSDLTCTLKLWFEHTAFFSLYGGLFFHALSDVIFVYKEKIPRKGSKIFSDDFRGRHHVKQQEVQGIVPVVKSFSVVLNNAMFFMLVLLVVYLILTTVLGVPRRDFVYMYMNLETEHYNICTMKEPVMETALYSFEGLLMTVGAIFCLMLRLQKSYLLETRGNPMVIIYPMVLITVMFIIIVFMELYSNMAEDSKQFFITVFSVSTAIIIIFSVCTSPLYLILSLKYDRLVIHEILLSDCSVENLMETINHSIHSIYGIDRYGQNAFQLALEYDIHDDILLELIRYFLPYDPETSADVPAEHHGYVWLYLVQKDSHLKLVEKVIQKYSAICLELANAVDIEGRIAVNIASKACQQLLRESTYFCQRYEITTMGVPIHVSQTCIVHLAIDHKNNNERVALKMMKCVDEYSREVVVRRDAQLSNDFVVEVLQAFDAVNNPEYLEAIKMRNFVDYPYCIVMPAADRELKLIITNEHIAGKDWGQIKYICIEVAKALQHLHSNGVIHGDINGKNIMRSGHRVRLIDFDASVSIEKDYVGVKCSSAFVPPEMIYFNDQKQNPLKSEASLALMESVDSKTVMEWKQYSGSYFEGDDHIGVKTYQVDHSTGEVINKEKLPYELIVAHDSFDIWSFGVVMFELCAGIALFLANSDEDILYENMLDLYAFSDKYKKKRMSEISNIEARNLIAQMLTKDPRKRPHIAQVLAHPFLSGKKAARMLGEKAEYDVFMSYRVQSDFKHAEILYEKLIGAGLKVWWDKKCLKPGVPWNEGFCDGMVKSLIFLPLLSRDAINNPSVEKQNFSCLTNSSYCDNVLLEHRLALELLERGFILNVYPVLIGDFVDDASGGSYTDYFLSGCHPRVSNVATVDSVEYSLQDQLNRLCFGTPLLEKQTVSVILDSIVKNQGCLIDGPPESAFDPVIVDVIQMVKQKRLGDESSYSSSRRSKAQTTVKMNRSSGRDYLITIVEPYNEALTPRELNKIS